MTKRLGFAILMFFISILMYAQTENQRHVVKKGENIYRISLKYGVSMDAIYKANPGSEDKVLAGQTLIIPTGDDGDSKSSTIPTGPYIVKSGDTKFSLSKRFGISIDELERRNPHIKPMLMSGQLIRLEPQNNVESNQRVVKTDDSGQEKNTESPSVNDDKEPDSETNTDSIKEPVVLAKESTEKSNSSEITTSPSSVNAKTEFIDYTVNSQETLYGLSKGANITISELLMINPQLKNGVKKGMVIKMPNPNFDGKKNNNSSVNFNTFVGTSIPDLLYSATKQNSNSISFHLPFTLNEYKNFIVKKDSSVFKIAPSKKSIDFYQGGTLAIKTINSLGLNFIAEFYDDTKSQESKNNSEISKNVVLFPYLNEYPFGQKQQLPDDLEVINIDSQVIPDNSTVYDAFPSNRIQQITTLNYIKKQKGHIIAISEIDRSETRKLIDSILVNPVIVDVDSNGQFDEKMVQSNLDKRKMNYVILDSEKSVLFLNATNLLLKSLSNYQINLVMLDKSLFPKEFNVSTKRFNILKTIYPSVHQITTTPNQLKFKAQYQEMFGEEPSKEAIFGFDITMDVMLRLSQESNFEQTVNQLKTRYINLKFDYDKTGFKLYENKGVFLYQYNGYDKINEIN